MTPLVWPAAAAVLLALLLRGVRWLYVNATWWQQPARLAIAAEPYRPPTPRAITAAPRIIQGTIVDTPAQTIAHQRTGQGG